VNRNEHAGGERYQSKRSIQLREDSCD